MSEQALREELVHWGRSLFERGLTSGSSGNMSVRLDDGYLFTPTNSCLGLLEPDRLSRLDATGMHRSGDLPTKELALHFAFYESRPNTRSVLHLRSPYATALSCLADLKPDDVIPPLTPYVEMKVGRVPIIPYTRPGSPEVSALIKAKARCAAVLLGNHGPVVARESLHDAVFASEELEAAAKVTLLTRGMKVRYLDPSDIALLDATSRLT